MFKKVSPIRLYENVTEQIMFLIKNDELKPGDRLPPERELAETFSISRASLREAFRVLESRGLIVSKPGGGRYIRELDKDTFIDTESVILNLEKSSVLELLEARELFEVKIVELAVQRATPEDIKVIERNFNRLIDDGDNNKKNTDDEGMTELDTEFHLSIARAARNFVFVNIMRLHFNLLKDIRLKTLQIPGRQEKQHQEHLAIFLAIKETNSQKAADAMLTHLKNIQETITSI